MSEEITSLRVRIDGTVQGVGFRAFALRQAVALELTGWVRNRRDGTLEALVAGPTKRVESFIGACMKGPPGARVQNIDLETDALPSGRAFVELPTA